MRKTRDEEPLLPPWVKGLALRAAPLAVLLLLYYILGMVMDVPAKILVPVLLVLGLGALVYLGGRLYKPFLVDRTGRCTASGARQRESCRHYVPGARLGGGCGRLRENGRCRYVT